MHAQEQAGAIGDGALVIAQARSIGSADFAEQRAAFGHDIGNAETIADFDQLAARDDDFGALGERIEDQKHRGGVVVDDDGGFGANQFGEQSARCERRVCRVHRARYRIPDSSSWRLLR